MFERGGEVRSGGEGEEVEARRGGQGGEGEGRSLFLGRVGEGWNGGVFTICACIHVESVCIVAVYVQKWNDNVRDSGLFFVCTATVLLSTISFICRYTYGYIYMCSFIGRSGFIRPVIVIHIEMR